MVNGDLLRQRAEIEELIAPARTLCDELRHVAETAGGDAGVLRPTGPGDGWQHPDLGAGAAAGAGGSGRVRRARPGAGRAGGADAAEPGEHVLADLGAVHAGGLGVTFYPTLAPEQVAFVAADCDARIAVLEGAVGWPCWQPVLDQLPGIKRVVVRDRRRLPGR